LFSKVKKAYYKLSLKFHPDKCDAEHRAVNTVKFQVLGKIYTILSDADKKKLYDETGRVDDDDGDLASKDGQSYWRNLFKKVTKADVDKFFVEYRNSPEERADLLRLYTKHSG
jgi:DnaJ family protein C protein 9